MAVNLKFNIPYQTGTVNLLLTKAISSGLNVKFYACSWQFTEYSSNPSIIGVFGLSQSWWGGSSTPDPSYVSRIAAAKAANPNYKALVYRDVKDIYNYWTDEFNLAQTNGWLLKADNGNLIVDSSGSIYLADIGNPAYQQWVAQRIASWLVAYPLFDGVFADNGLFVTAGAWQYYVTATAINPRTGNPFTDAEIENAYVAVQNAIKSAIGNKILVCNGLWSGDYFYGLKSSFQDLLNRSSLDGAMAEGCWYKNSGQWETVAEWQQSLQMVSELQSYFDKPNGALVQCCFIDVGLPSGATQTQLLLYGFCSSLLAAQNDKNYVGVQSGTTALNATILQLMEKLNGLVLGSALNSYSQISGTQVYTRDFQYVKVLVNPSSSSYTVSLSGAYHTIDGTAVLGSYSIAPYTGVVLII